MIRINISEKDMDLLHYERYNHPHPRVMQKMEALMLKGNGLSHDEICRICRISPNTLRSYLKDYMEGGVEKLKELRFHGRKSSLSKESVESEFAANPPHTLKEAARRIEGMTGIRRSIPQIRSFMLKIGMKRLKTGSVPGKADTEKQEEYKKKRWMFS